MITDRPLMLIIVLAIVSLAPFVAMMITSFVKISVVLSILRSALGTQQIPPTPVIMGLSLILTLYIMTPVGIEIRTAAQSVIVEKTGQSSWSAVTMDVFLDAGKAACEPVRKFLSKHAHEKDKNLFYRLAVQMNRKSPDLFDSKEDLLVLMPAFIISELREAFEIGFLIFIPFLIIDMVVSNILLSMGMFMLSPATISLPFKLLLFVMVDGWYLLARGLVLGYM
jgi:type III secretion protein R